MDGSYNRYYNACGVMRRKFHAVLKERKVSFRGRSSSTGRFIHVFSDECSLIHDTGCLLYYTGMWVTTERQIEWTDNPILKADKEIK
jgi:hypothetical protein